MNLRTRHKIHKRAKGAKQSSSFFFCALCLFVFFVASHFSFAQRAKPKPSSRTFTFDATESRIDIILTQEGLIGKRYPTHRVVVKSFSGKVELPKDETSMSVAMEAEAKSLTNADEAMGDFERKGFHDVLRNTVLEISKHPTIKFVSASVSKAQKSGNTRSFTLAGDLILHGVTKRVEFPVNATLSGDELRATGEAKLKQSDFAMQPFERGMGLIKIGDEVKVAFNVVAKAQ